MKNQATATDGKKQTYGIGTDWANVDLKSPCESALNMLDPYSFDTLLLEISCNLPVINTQTVKAQALESLRSKYSTALEILNDNLENITLHAQKERSRK